MLNLVGRRAASHIAPLTSSQYNNLWFILGNYILAAHLINFTSIEFNAFMYCLNQRKIYSQKKKSK